MSSGKQSVFSGLTTILVRYSHIMMGVPSGDNNYYPSSNLQILINKDSTRSIKLRYKGVPADIKIGADVPDELSKYTT